MALTKCKECGKEISKDAEICPHCGKKIKKGNLFLKIVGLIFIIGFIGNLIHNDESNNVSYSNSQRQSTLHKMVYSDNNSKIPENVEYQKITLGTLEKNLQENAARAQQQYQGVYVEFDGRLEVIDANGEYFSVQSGSFLSDIHCSIKNEQQKQVLISKNKGNIVHVKGKITQVGEILGYRIDVIELK